MRRFLWSLAVLLLLAPGALGAASFFRSSLPSASPATCGGCHVDKMSAWSGSRHAVAFSNEAFQVSWARTESPWCESCHASASREDGTACLSCHGDGDALKGDHPTWRARLAHPIRHDPTLKTERTCEGCHQFSLPSPGELTAGHTPMPFAPTPSQDTVGEWRASTAAEKGLSCIACHDPHEAPGAHDHAFVRGALEVDARYEQGKVFATLRARNAAHAVPTGDPFRRIELAICGPGPCEHPLASAVLERKRRASGGDWVVTSDTRIPAATGGAEMAERTLVLTPTEPLPPGSRWRLVYHFPEALLEGQLQRNDRYFVIDQGPLGPGDQDVL